MKQLLKRISYKMLVSSMIAICLSFFIVTSCSHANKFSDLLNDDGIYYTGTQDATLTVGASIWQKIVSALSAIAGFIVGLMGLAIRGVFIGWIEIAELLLTSILDLDNGFFSTAASAMFGADNGTTINDDSLSTYTENVINVESIIYGKVPILDANFFETTSSNVSGDNLSIVNLIKESVAKWYYILRLVVIAFMLLLLIYIGIKMALSTIASEKATYKRMLVDWVVGMIIVFMIHYIMVAVFAVNDSVVDALSGLTDNSTTQLEEYEYGDGDGVVENEDMETTLYESARTRAYSLSLTDGFTGMVIYGVLVYYAWRFAIVYIIRMFNIMVLTIISPVIAASYAVNKVMSGKSQIFSNWLREYIMNVFIQLFHVIIYVSFVSIALDLSMQSIMGAFIAFVILHFMLQADKLLKTIFRMEGGNGSLDTNKGLGDVRKGMKNLSNTVVGGQMGKAAVAATYKIATKPVAKIAEAGFGRAMEKKANELEVEKEKKEKEFNDLKNEKQELEEKINQKRMLEENESKGLFDPNNLLKDFNKENPDLDERYEEAKDKLDEELELRRLEQDEKTFMKMTLEGGLKNIVNPYNYVEQGKDGKYHRIKTRRQGNVKGAFWRKKTDSIGQRFMASAKLSKVLNLSPDEINELKTQLNIVKSNIAGFFAAMVGFPAMVVEPSIGIALLGQATSSRMRIATRRRQIKNMTPRTKERYKFNGFNLDAQYTIQREAARQIEEIEDERVETVKRKHKNFFKRAATKAVTFDVDPIQSAKMNELAYAKWVKNAKYVLADYNEFERQWAENAFRDEMEAQENDELEKAEKKSKKDLLFDEHLTDDNTVAVGDNIFKIGSGTDSENATTKFANDASKEMFGNSSLSREDKINNVKKLISDNQELLIENQIKNMYAQKGVMDISKTKITDDEVKQAKNQVLDILVEKGVIKRGEIDVNEVITDSKIQDVHANMKAEKEKTNEELQQKIAINSVLEYMEKTGVTDASQLKDNIDDIYDIVRDKVMTDSERVVANMGGKQIDLSEFMKTSVEKSLLDAEEVNLTSINEEKSDLAKRAANRKMNKKKEKLEQVIGSGVGNDDETVDTETLERLLEKVGKTYYVAAKRNGKKQAKKKESQMDIFNEYFDGSKRFDPSKDGSRSVQEEYFVSHAREILETGAFGPDRSLFDLIYES